MFKTRTPRSTSMAQILQSAGDKRGNGNKFHLSEGIFAAARSKAHRPENRPMRLGGSSSLLFRRVFFTRTGTHPGSSPGQAFARKRSGLSERDLRANAVGREENRSPPPPMRGRPFRIMLSMGGPPVFLR